MSVSAVFRCAAGIAGAGLIVGGILAAGTAPAIGVTPVGAGPGPGRIAGAGRVAASAGSWFIITRTCLPFCTSTIKAGATTKLTVTAYRPGVTGIWKGFAGHASFLSSDPQAVVPADYDFTSADQGSRAFDVQFRTEGQQTFTAMSGTVNAGTYVVGTSDVLTIVPGDPSRLLFTVQPVGAAAGSPFTHQPAASVEDAYGNHTAATIAVTLGLIVPAGVSASLTCTSGPTISAVNGYLVWFGCTVDKAGTGYRVAASASGVSTATSQPFNMGPGPTPTPTPTPSPTPTPTPTPMPTPSPTTGPAPTLSPTPTPTPTPSTTPHPSGGAGTGTAILLVASAGLATAATPVTFRAAVANAGAGRLTVLEQRVRHAATWTMVGSAPTDASGVVTFVYRPTVTAEYRAVWSGDATLPTGTSASVWVGVTWNIAVAPTATTRVTSPGKSLAWVAKVQPAGVTTVQFAIYQRVGSSWVLRGKATRITTASGTASFSWQFTTIGRYYLGVSALTTDLDSWGVAPKKYVTVK